MTTVRHRARSLTHLTLARRAIVASLAIAVLTAGWVPLAATAHADTRDSPLVGGCLWAAKTYEQGATVVAADAEYRCGTQAAAAYWFRGAPTTEPSTVANPGAITTPIDQFSAGARQPGTSYNDYCVGDQLIPGTDDIYQVVRHGNGFMQWKAVAPIGQWPFGSAPRPEPTWRSASLCIDGVLT
ncbi:hypothetical protein [Nocardia fluminea]|uniref:Uncharacterized protein n=1 Tax=Nocardia fluminea TaxID=134984 RepID=A0A2N3VDH5_9NOCA|nr:hypothetical protein [Nocardia fluminea]PKV79666.1 hypothetical protein ATK86_4072 [Nocardia fluminea]